MNQKSKFPFKTSDHIKFILPSLLGILLFMVPFQVEIEGEESFTIPVAYFAELLQVRLADELSAIMTIIITITALATIVVKATGGDRLAKFPFFQSLFDVSAIWTSVRILGAIFAILTLFKIGPEFIYSGATGGLLLNDLLHVLFTVFLFAGLFLPLLLNFGLLEFFGTMLTVIMRPVFKLPGRSSIDSLASWLGDGTIGVLLTSKQYQGGHYTKREAAIIGTTFSVVSITFTLVVIDKVDLSHMFPAFYGTVLLSGVIAAIIMPRIPPLSKKENTYITGEQGEPEPKSPQGYNVLTWGYYKALERSKTQTSVKDFFKNGAQNILDMWMGVAPIVMALGTIALVIAEYTPVFTWLGMPFIPLLELMQIPEASAASETILVGFADMFLPALIGSSIESEMTRFIIAALSVTQLIYMSEVGGLLLGSNIPINLRELFIIFLERTIITLPIITLIAHMIF
ncbi:YjiH family protein [Pontibacillus yanchengensis]|uniref:YjiH family protein n=1 Tax=Pontibacillus yanchengensis TaxID=462910 RepID=A0ACC7VIK8_9BACI|nr:YjiH family protein [Pontibacillus yanchengensis]MYL54532.1 YjiH family protein [Pontibacillus yanchengensis]